MLSLFKENRNVECDPMQKPFVSWTTTLRSLGLGGILLAAAPSAPGEITGSFVLNGDGTITYFYQVDNSSGLFDVSQWSLDFDFAAPDWDPVDTFSGGDVTVPDLLWIADGGDSVSGASAQDFLAVDAAADVLVGTVRGGFSFTSSLPPGRVTYHEFSAQGDSASGTTVGPTGVIPEASSWVSGLTLGALAGGLLIRRRSKSESRP